MSHHYVVSGHFRCSTASLGRAKKRLIICFVAFVAWSSALTLERCWAQIGVGGGLGNQAVGGISIDADGIIQNLEPKALETLAEERRKLLADAPAPNGKPSKLRKVSLMRLVTAAEQFVATGKPLSPEVLFLGGLERITHLFVDPEGHDIILAGPAGTAAIDPAGNIINAASGRPLLQLEEQAAILIYGAMVPPCKLLLT